MRRLGKNLVRSLWAIGLLLAWAEGSPTALAQGIHLLGGEAAVPTEYDEQHLSIWPAAEPAEPLALPLLPPLAERRPGNAAVIYNKAGLWYRQSRMEERDVEVNSLLDAPLAEMPLEQAQALLHAYGPLFGMLEQAARRTECDWQLPVGEVPFISIILPEIQDMRSYHRALLLKARVEIREGRYAEAFRTLQADFALARNAGRGPTLINCLVGVAIATQISADLASCSGLPDAPNLYWAVSTLPSPLIDFRLATETEMESLFLSYPMLRDAEHATFSAAAWRELAGQLRSEMQMLYGDQASGRDLGFLGAALAGYPLAKHWLIESGRDPQEVEELPVMQVLAIYSVHKYRELRDRQFKWALLPEGELQASIAGLRRNRIQQGEEVVPFASMLLPPLDAVRLAPARLQRRLVVCRTLEALRLHAAAQGGAWPDSLDEIDAVPIPVDPFTGRPLEYIRQGDAATLTAAPFSELGVRGIRVSLQLQ